nr:MAG TPA: hypothetical protein [Caudoviricetes sp.]
MALFLLSLFIFYFFCFLLQTLIDNFIFLLYNRIVL